MYTRLRPDFVEQYIVSSEKVVLGTSGRLCERFRAVNECFITKVIRRNIRVI